MTEKKAKALKPLDRVQNLGSLREYAVGEIEPEILLVRAVIGENLSVRRLYNPSEWTKIE